MGKPRRRLRAVVLAVSLQATLAVSARADTVAPDSLAPDSLTPETLRWANNQFGLPAERTGTRKARGPTTGTQPRKSKFPTLAGMYRLAWGPDRPAEEVAFFRLGKQSGGGSRVEPGSVANTGGSERP